VTACKASVQHTKKGQQLNLDRLEPYSGSWLQKTGEYRDALAFALVGEALGGLFRQGLGGDLVAGLQGLDHAAEGLGGRGIGIGFSDRADVRQNTGAIRAGRGQGVGRVFYFPVRAHFIVGDARVLRLEVAEVAVAVDAPEQLAAGDDQQLPKTFQAGGALGDGVGREGDAIGGDVFGAPGPGALLAAAGADGEGAQGLVPGGGGVVGGIGADGQRQQRLEDVLGVFAKLNEAHPHFA
jgi:hypothetical protein